MSEWGNPAAKAVSPQGRRTGGTEPSKYPQEKKSKEIPQVVASERGGAQTGGSNSIGVVGRLMWNKAKNLNLLGSRAIEGDSPVEVIPIVPGRS